MSRGGPGSPSFACIQSEVTKRKYCVSNPNFSPNINIHNLVNTLHQPISVVFGGKRTVFVVVLVQLEGSAKNIWFFVHFAMRNGPRTTKEIGLKRELI